MSLSTTGKNPLPFGKYLLLDRINIGGMAEVWRGKQFGAGGFERIVAIKRILPNIAEDDEFISMFIDEAKISVQLTHANIAQTYDLGEIIGSYYIAMEYVPGKDLRAIFERARKKGEPAPVPFTAFVISKLCEGLDYAHRKKDGLGRDMNIVHRDISPQNVLISFDGEVKIIDFGIAKAAGKATKTQAGILKGKFGYMSPEQIRGLPLDRRSDVFAIGVCLYELLTGERLFVGESDFAVLEKVRKAEVLPPSRYNKRVPESLEKIVLKALARDVDQRYQYASEMGEDLQRFLLTSEASYGRKDLMLYMKSTFAEEVEREKIRLQEYADIKPPEGESFGDGDSDSSDDGYSQPAPSRPSSPSLVTSPPRASSPNLPQQAPVPLASAPPAASNPSVPTAFPQLPTQPVVRRSPTLTNPSLPKLTVAAPSAIKDENAPTQVVTEAAAEIPADRPEERGTTPGAHLRRGTNPSISYPPAPAAQLQPASADATGIVPPPSAEREDPTGPIDQPAHPPAPAARGRASNPELPRNPGEHARAEPKKRPSGSRPAPKLAEAHPEPAVAPIEPVVHRPPPPAPPWWKQPIALGIAAGVLVALLGVAGFVTTRSAPIGYLLVNVPREVRAKARLNLSGTDLGIPSSWPVLQKVPAGPAVVLVTADGYEPFAQPVVIKPGEQPTSVEAQLKPVDTSAQLVVVTEPDTAEVRLNGKVVKAQGSTSFSFVDVPLGKEQVVEVRQDGFVARSEKVTARDTNPVRLSIKLAAEEIPLQVSSKPSGATILVNGRELGVTPAQLKVRASETPRLMLLKRCYDPVQVPVLPQGNGLAPVSASLHKQPGCR